VACTKARFNSEPFNGVQDHKARNVGGELSISGVFEFFSVGIEQEACNVFARNGGGFFNEFPAVVIDPRSTHTGALRALAGECKSEH
jgi:hypothetical protein